MMKHSRGRVVSPATALVIAGAVLLSACSAAVPPAAPAASVAVSDEPVSVAPVPSAPPPRSPTPGPTTARPSANAASAKPSASAAPAERGAFAGLVSAGGVRQWLSCAGPGPLTLVVVPGLGSSSAAWSAVLPGFRRFVRTCVYDRPGLGRSPNRASTSQVLDAGLQSGELWSLLQAAGELGPYVVLGHSYGGLVGRALVAAHRSSVRGVFLAESVSPGDPSTGRYWTEAGHQVDLLVSGYATHGGPPLGSSPLLVMSASRPDADHLTGPSYGQPQWMTTLWVRLQKANLTLSTNGIQVVAHSGHVLQQDNPPAVVEAARELIVAARSGGPLICSGSWTRLAATCT